MISERKMKKNENIYMQFHYGTFFTRQRALGIDFIGKDVTRQKEALAKYKLEKIQKKKQKTKLLGEACTASY
jgi:hypothetical protein